MGVITNGNASFEMLETRFIHPSEDTLVEDIKGTGVEVCPKVTKKIFFNFNE